ncbi:6,7-dimethyl-8-ribityllumazine synthase [Magnetospira sp. QH-2]|uniref:6,7-dimethyl-8-ribityllumazine synthase n=1 Tax=Magnetospira sp. (strain QH-2) TaxID=1288970 RepID=UPI0003E81766|nr:6,7-dimethyl-8-ribityllumazine synthase [Magnetospira sp. QH-2]CCQ73827.1 Riboflavin synthase, beta chain [Magnetospira sp. QH-2]
MIDGPRILIVEGRFYEDIGQELLKGATQVLEKAGIPYEHILVPGALEIPSVIKYALQGMAECTTTSHYVGVVSLGCVIRGETSHYDVVCTESFRAVTDLVIEHGMPHGYGVLTVENKQQALVRADTTGKDFGGRAAVACLRLLDIKKSFDLA